MWSFKDWVIVIGCAAGFAFLMVNGLLMFLSPQKSVEFLSWWTRADRFSKPNPGWKPGDEWETRLAGFAMAVLGGFVLVMMGLYLIHPRAVAQAPTPAPTPVPSMGLTSLVALLLMNGAVLVLGAYTLAKPERIVHWITERAVPYRVFPPLTPKRLWPLRLMGALGILLSTWDIFILLGRSSNR